MLPENKAIHFAGNFLEKNETDNGEKEGNDFSEIMLTYCIILRRLDIPIYKPRLLLV